MSSVINHHSLANPEALTIDSITSQYTGAAENVYVPEGVTAIGEWTFWYNGSNNETIKRIRIPNSMARIYGHSFVSPLIVNSDAIEIKMMKELTYACMCQLLKFYT